ncbi:hypothetical protein WR25_04601 isoform A [Diploscapter pachys]|uniref:C2H2-type domain-containing protein n=1 Tax=Diploscapter pachys TaxID=2018661 RepID=A0A2A2LL27_9BILA|nr:hypothetical protein WR25_04601 isoform A [Diploscapter pachys]
MVSRSAAASRAVGVRASVADLKHFMCYFCGDMFKNKDEFNLHRFNHQIEDIAYQVAQNEFKRTRDEKPLNDSDEEDNRNWVEEVYSERKLTQPSHSQTSASARTKIQAASSNRPILTPKYLTSQGKVDGRRRGSKQNKQLPPPPPLHIPSVHPHHSATQPQTSLSSSDLSTPHYFPSPLSDAPSSASASHKPRRIVASHRTVSVPMPSVSVPIPPESISLSLDESQPSAPIPHRHPASPGSALLDTINAVAMGISGGPLYPRRGQRRNDQNPLAGGDYSNLQQTEVELDRFEMMLPPEEVSLFPETAPPVAATVTLSPPKESPPVKKPPAKQIVTKQSDEEYVRNIIETVSAESALQMEMQTQEKRKAAGGKRKRNSSSNILNEEAVVATVPASAVNAEPPPIKKSKEKSMTPNDASGDRSSASQNVLCRRTTKCHLCDFEGKSSHDAVHHMNSAHKCVIASCSVRLLRDSVQLNKYSIRHSDKCPECEIRFHDRTSYYMHVIDNHILDVVAIYKVVYEDVDSYEWETFFCKDDQDNESYVTVLSGAL